MRNQYRQFAVNAGSDPYTLGNFMEIIHRNADELDRMEVEAIRRCIFSPQSEREEILKSYARQMRNLLENERQHFSEAQWQQITPVLDQVFFPLNNSDMIE